MFGSESEVRSDTREVRLVGPVTWECEKCSTCDGMTESAESVPKDRCSE